MYIFFNPIKIPDLERRQVDYIVSLFSVANDLIQLNRLVLEYGDKMIIFPLSQQIVTELHTWRHGFEKMTRRKFKFLGTREYDISARLTEEFDTRFGKVKGHRNVLQHFGSYLFGDQDPANVKHSEVNRLRLPFGLEGGSIGGIYGSYHGELFCSSDWTGLIHEVHLGPGFAGRVKEMINLATMELNHSGEMEINILDNLSYDEYQRLSYETLHRLLNGPRY